VFAHSRSLVVAVPALFMIGGPAYRGTVTLG